MLVGNDRLVLYFIIILMRKVQKKPSNTDYVIAFTKWAVIGALVYWVILWAIAFVGWLMEKYTWGTVLFIMLWIVLVLGCGIACVLDESEKYENDTDKTTNM